MKDKKLPVVHRVIFQSITFQSVWFDGSSADTFVDAVSLEAVLKGALKLELGVGSWVGGGTGPTSVFVSAPTPVSGSSLYPKFSTKMVNVDALEPIQ